MPPNLLDSIGNGLPDYSDEQPIILGAQLANPYTRENMAVAYNIVYGTNYVAANLPVTHYYIKFTPQSDQQLADLEENTELELYTHPLDYELLQDGDYYAAPGKTPNDIPELYTVVAVDDVIPNFLPHVILANLHIPPNDDLLVEEIAESQAAGASYARSPDGDSSMISRTDTSGIDPLRLPPICENTGEPVWGLEPCIGGGGGGGGGPTLICGAPPLTTIEAGRPRGRLRYWDTQLNGGTCVAIKDIKVVGKNWFKGIAPRNHMYTDAAGIFVHSKKFKRVKINVKFRNAAISVRPLRSFQFIKLSLFNLKSNLGNFTGAQEMNRVEKVFYRPADKKSKEMDYWVASQVIQGLNEYRGYAATDELKMFSGWRLKYFLQRDDIARTRGPEARVPMHSYIHNTQSWIDIANSIIKMAGYAMKGNYFVAGLELMRQVLAGQRADVILNYNTYTWNNPNSFENFSSSEMHKEIYSSFTKVSVIKNSGSNEVKNYLKREDKTISAAISLIGAGMTIFNDGLYKYLKAFYKNIYNDPNQTTPPAYPGQTWAATLAAQYTGVFTWVSTIMVWTNSVDEEYFDITNGFADYYGHTLCNREYGTQADKFYNERKLEVIAAGGLGPHIRFLEDYMAQAPDDENQTYKVGLFYDLEDTNAELVLNGANLSRQRTDLVSGIKPKDMFKCITEEPGQQLASTWQKLKQNLIAKFGTQIININELCFAYGID